MQIAWPELSDWIGHATGHATGHGKAHASHPTIRSYEPGEDWWWCYADDLFFEVEGAPPAPSHS